MNPDSARDKINKLAQANEAFMFLIDFEMENIKIWESDQIPSDILYQLGPFSNVTSYNLAEKELAIQRIKPYSSKRYKKAFARVQEEINYGNSFLLNLTGKSQIFTPYSLEEIFFLSRAPYKLYYQNQFVFFSPESFIKIHDNVITSYPMKGTIDADLENAQELILADKKESSEHNTIVDLIRNDMSQYAKNVHVSKFRYIDKIKTAEKNLLQVSSEIKGELPPGYKNNLGDIILSQLPAGSISGAPKPKTIEIIKEVENEKRGYYTGVAGYYDGSVLDSCVMIRFIEKTNDRYYYRSGGGITFMSEADKEYKELLQKIYVPTY